jgi:hypothetical protein
MMERSDEEFVRETVPEVPTRELGDVRSLLSINKRWQCSATGPDTAGAPSASVRTDRRDRPSAD